MVLRTRKFSIIFTFTEQFIIIYLRFLESVLLENQLGYSGKHLRLGFTVD